MYFKKPVFRIIFLFVLVDRLDLDFVDIIYITREKNNAIFGAHRIFFVNPNVISNKKIMQKCKHSIDPISLRR